MTAGGYTIGVCTAVGSDLMTAGGYTIGVCAAVGSDLMTAEKDDMVANHISHRTLEKT